VSVCVCVCVYVCVCVSMSNENARRPENLSRPSLTLQVRGEYLVLRPEKRHLVRGNIYPVIAGPCVRSFCSGICEFTHWQTQNVAPAIVADGQVPYPGLPFLGVHFTPRMDGSLWLGPNAVLALARQGYSWAAWKMCVRPLRRLARVWGCFPVCRSLRACMFLCKSPRVFVIESAKPTSDAFILL
jgi:hypothetical protein